MTTTHHTPGPWHTVEENGRTGILTADNVTHIATMTRSIYEPRQEANARLLAAAPKILEALNAIVQALDDKSGLGKDAGRGAVYWDDAEAEAARAAIQQATEQE